MTMDSVPALDVPRLRRFRRHPSRKPALVLQARDLDILRTAAAYRVLTSDDICALIPGSDQNLLRRLQKLYHTGHLDRPRSQRQRGNQSMVYALGQAGAQLVSELTGNPVLGTKDWAEKNRQLQHRYLEHALMISRFRAVLQLAINQRTDVALEAWRPDGELRDAVMIETSPGPMRVPVCPDGYFVLHLRNEPPGQNRIHVFFEADQGTMTLERFCVKTLGYWHYWRTGRVTERFNIGNFLVVTVARTSERARNLAAITRTMDAPRHRGLRMFLFGSADQYALTAPGRILDAIWRSAGDQEAHSFLE